jgi:uncharacterized protein (DUF1684 family)
VARWRPSSWLTTARRWPGCTCPVGLAEFRARRDELFAGHPQSPIPPAERARFSGLRYFPPSDDAIVEVPLREEPGRLEIDTGGPDGIVRYQRVGVLSTAWGPLSIWWIVAYGGGLFLPMRDATSGRETYGGVGTSPTR